MNLVNYISNMIKHVFLFNYPHELPESCYYNTPPPQVGMALVTKGNLSYGHATVGQNAYEIQCYESNVTYTLNLLLLQSSK